MARPRSQVTPTPAIGSSGPVPPGLVGVNHDPHVVANGLADQFDHTDVFGQGLVVRAQLDRQEAAGFELQGPFGDFLDGTDGDQAGVGADAILVQAPENRQRQLSGFGCDVAERHVDNPAAADPAQHIGVALGGKGVLADELRGDVLADQLPVAGAGTADADDAVVSGDLHDGGGTQGLDDVGMPGGAEFLWVGDLEGCGLDANDFQRCPPRI